MFIIHVLAEMAGTLGDDIGFEQFGRDKGLEPVSADRMVTEGLPAVLPPWTARWEHLQDVLRALDDATDMNTTTFQWPLEHELLVKGMEGCVQSLREALKDLPAEDLEMLARTVVPAEAFLASLRDDDNEGGDA